jgi:NADPH:quinone reductase
VQGTRVIIRAQGDSSVLELEAFAVPEPQAGQVLLRQTAIGLNFLDIYHRSGVYPLPSLPHGIGAEAVGEVIAVGEGASQLQLGQRVAYVSGPPGSYATHRNVAVDTCIPLPDSVSDVEVAAALLKGMTVEYLIRRLYPVRSGQFVLFHAAAGGVGLLACQWLRHLGARVIGTVGSAEKAERARAHGCEFPVLYREESLVQRVTELTGGKMVEVAYDSVGRETLEQSLSCLAPRGLLVAFGNASGAPPPLDLLRLSRGGSLYVTRPKLSDYTATREELLACAEQLFAVFAAGAVRPVVGATFALDQVREAHRALESRSTSGSVVLVP